MNRAAFAATIVLLLVTGAGGRDLMLGGYRTERSG
jgi:hypothetical protein